MQRRKTQTQEAVLTVLRNSDRALSQDSIEQQVEVTMDRATIYRILARFHEDGIVHRIVAADGKQYFALCTSCDDQKLPDHHFHFRCTICDTIECLSTPVQLALPRGYRMEGVNCVVSGVCPSCGKKG